MEQILGYALLSALIAAMIIGGINALRREVTAGGYIFAVIAASMLVFIAATHVPDPASLWALRP